MSIEDLVTKMEFLHPGFRSLMEEQRPWAREVVAALRRGELKPESFDLTEKPADAD